MVVQLRVLDFILFFWGITMSYAILAETASFEAPPPIAKPNCQSHYGTIEISYKDAIVTNEIPFIAHRPHSNIQACHMAHIWHSHQ